MSIRHSSIKESALYWYKRALGPTNSDPKWSETCFCSCFYPRVSWLTSLHQEHRVCIYMGDYSWLTQQTYTEIITIINNKNIVQISAQAIHSCTHTSSILTTLHIIRCSWNLIAIYWCSHFLLKIRGPPWYQMSHSNHRFPNGILDIDKSIPYAGFNPIPCALFILYTFLGSVSHWNVSVIGCAGKA